MTTFCPSILGPRNIPLAHALLEKGLSTYPSSALHLWNKGKLRRLQRNIPEAILAFEQAIGNSSWKVLHYLSEYELGIAYGCMLEWDKARHYLKEIGSHSYWSRCLFTFFQGVCKDMVGDREGYVYSILN